MKGSLNRKYNFSIIVTAEDIKSLSDMITKDFKEVCYEIETNDGAQYKIQDLNAILEYSNPDSRKIIRIRIRGNREKEEISFLPNICISLFDTSVYEKSIILDLNEMDEKDINHYTSRIDEFANRIKAPYWWIYKDKFYWVCGIILYFTFSFIYFSNTDITNTINKVYSILLLQGVSVACMVFSMFALSKVVSFFFPESCFALGEQKKHMLKKEKVRSILIWTIGGALIVSIISSIIAHLLIKTYLN